MSKSFAGRPALDGVDFEAKSGEVHAIAGANGAGKSTLMNLLSGVFRPSAGEILLDGEAVHFASPAEARDAGVSTVYQELSSIPQLTVAENIFLGREPCTRLGRIDKERLRGEAKQILDESQIALSPDARVGDLSIAQRQLVELARGLAFSPRILILDEPTAVLSGREIDNLFTVVRRLRAQGLLVLYVSHRFEEVFAIADRITVLRDGRRIDTAPTSEMTSERLVRAMIGRAAESRFSLPPLSSTARTLLRARWHAGGEECELALREGEILGLAGLVGAGRTEIALRLIGGYRDTSLSLELDGEAVSHLSPRRMLQRGVVYLTEDRKQAGLFANLSVLANTTAAILPGISRGGVIVGGKEKKAAKEVLERLGLVHRSLDQPASELSGGNQQKLLTARALLTAPKLLICDEPTRGVDVGAKEEIFALLSEIAARGVGIILISSEINELVRLCHRLIVIRNHAVVEELPGQEVDENQVLAAAAGLSKAIEKQA
ncbi:MAG: sugar ABC transporter ATP-binding protein [Rhodovibrionaceae bacterium]